MKPISTSISRQNRIYSLIGVLLVITLAVICRRIVYDPDMISIGDAANNIRIFLYIGLFTIWGVSVNRRVMQAHTRQYLTLVAAIMVIWLVVRELKWHYLTNPDMLLYAWYLYYLPLLFIPLIALFVSLSLGRPEDYRLPVWAKFLYIPTSLLAMMVLTNNLHQFVFKFPSDATIWSENDYSYGPGFYLVSLWIMIISVWAFALMILSKRRSGDKSRVFFPLIPFAVFIVYVLVYSLKLPFLYHLLDDLTVTECLFFAAFFESCIQCGLIPVNTRYFELFIASRNLNAIITDNDYNIRYEAVDASQIDTNMMEQASENPIMTDDDKELHNIPVAGGHMIWTDDLSELMRIREELRDTHEELSDRNDLLELEYEHEKEHRTVEIRNHLYDLLQTKTLPRLNRIDQLIDEYKNNYDRQIIANIIVLGSYIKRRRDIVLQSEVFDINHKDDMYDNTETDSDLQNAYIPISVLENAISESARALRLLDIRVSTFIQVKAGVLSGEQMLTVYDLFEDIAEILINNNAGYITLRISDNTPAIRCIILTDSVSRALSAIHDSYPELVINQDEEDGTELILNFNAYSAVGQAEGGII